MLTTQTNELNLLSVTVSNERTLTSNNLKNVIAFLLDSGREGRQYLELCTCIHLQITVAVYFESCFTLFVSLKY